MLITCPECALQISDKAIMCPHCGYPMQPEKSRSRSRPSRRKRLPNGFGRISEIKGKNLRKPFRAMVTIGFSENGRPIGKLLKPQAYFETYNEAYAALMEYNRDPYDASKDLTVQEVYKEWSIKHFQTIKDSSAVGIMSAWAYCSSAYKLKISEVRTKDIRYCMESGYTLPDGPDGARNYASPQTQRRIKNVWALLLDYAVEYEYTDKNYARMITTKIQSTDVKQHMSYTDDEMRLLWENISSPYAEMMIIQCYTGWRPQELLNLTSDNVDIVHWIMTGGLKTEAGKDRVVPIHPRIRSTIKKIYDESLSREYGWLFVDRKGRRMNYSKYSYGFSLLKNSLGLNEGHRLHDGRKHFVTMAKAAGVDEYAIKRLVGHSIKDITEKVYTDRSVEWLRKEIEKIP